MLDETIVSDDKLLSILLIISSSSFTSSSCARDRDRLNACIIRVILSSKSPSMIMHMNLIFAYIQLDDRAHINYIFLPTVKNLLRNDAPRTREFSNWKINYYRFMMQILKESLFFCVTTFQLLLLFIIVQFKTA